MGYEHRNGKLPDHVDRSGNNSDPRYGHPKVQADATSVAKPDYKRMQRSEAAKKNADQDVKDAEDYLSGRSIAGGLTKDTYPMLQYQQARGKQESDSLAADIKDAKKRRGSTGPG